MAIVNGKIRCPVCEEAKGLSYFTPRDRLRGSGTCKPCNSIRKRNSYYADQEKHLGQAKKRRDRNPELHRKNNKKWRDENPDKVKNHALKKSYGLSLAEYNKLLVKQKGMCAICKIEASKTFKGLFVDHCHGTLKIRGLLCRRCNTGLGLLGDNLRSLKRAVAYLEKGN